MNLKKQIIKKTLHPRNLLLATALISIGCQPQPKLVDGTPAQGLEARTDRDEGTAKIVVLETQMAAAINKISAIHPATRLIVVEPPVLPIAPVAETTLSAHYGTKLYHFILIALLILKY